MAGAGKHLARRGPELQRYVGTAPATSPRTSMDWGRGEYERTAALLIPAAEAVIRAAELRPGGSAVDVGCGTGTRAGEIRGGRAPVTPCGTGMWCWSASSVGGRARRMRRLPRRRWAWRRSPGWPGCAGGGAAAGSLGLPADDLGSAAPCRRLRRAGAPGPRSAMLRARTSPWRGAAVSYSKPPQGLVPQRVVGVSRRKSVRCSSWNAAP